MRHTILVALGGAAGSVARYWLGEWMAHAFGPAFPWGTLLVNLSGSVLIGLLAGLLNLDGRPLLGVDWRLLLMTGLCGGYTTFSAFSLQTLMLAQVGQWGRAATYAAVSLVGCLAAVWVGWALAQLVNLIRAN